MRSTEDVDDKSTLENYVPPFYALNLHLEYHTITSMFRSEMLVRFDKDQRVRNSYVGVCVVTFRRSHKDQGIVILDGLNGLLTVSHEYETSATNGRTRTKRERRARRTTKTHSMYTLLEVQSTGN